LPQTLAVRPTRTGRSRGAAVVPDGSSPRAAPLREREFRLLIVGQAISTVGVGMMPIALVFVVFRLTHDSASDLGLVLAAGYATQLGLLLVGGVVADRVARRTLMVSALLWCAAVQATLAVLVITGSATFSALIVLMVLYAIAGAFFWPALSGVIPSTVPAESLQSANSILGMSGGAGVIVGPLLAGILVPTVGAGPTLALGAASLGVSAVVLSMMAGGQAASTGRRSFTRELADGFAEVRGRAWLWLSMLSSGLLLMVGVAPVQVLGPLVARRYFGGATAWAVMVAAFAAGGVAGGALALRLRPARPLFFTYLCLLVALPANVLLAIPGPLAAIVGAQFVGGISVGLDWAIWDTLLQQQIPAHALSRVTAYEGVSSLAFSLIGIALAGPAANTFGLRETLIGGALVGAIGIVAVVSVREVRNVGYVR
jgi:Major Facilitator Superfamily